MNPELPRYREVRPGRSLAPYVQCYWTIIAGATPSLVNRVCPDGCADIIVDLAAQPPTGGCVDGRCTSAVGTMQSASRVEMRGATPAELAAETRAVGFVQYESDLPQ